MAFSRKQMVAIIMRLKAKGLIKYVKRAGPRGTVPLPRVVSAASSSKSVILDQKRITKLLARLPQHHVFRRENPTIFLHNASSMRWTLDLLDPEEATFPRGLYEISKNTIHVRGDYMPYGKGMGYAPLHIPKGKRIASAIGSKVLTLLDRKRNGIVGATKAFYHEFAHSLDIRSNKNGTYTIKKSWGDDWVNVVKSEWLLSPKAKDYDPEMLKVHKVYTEDPLESWADSYSLYATSKVSRSRLKREYPLSYEYMKKFFEEK